MVCHNKINVGEGELCTQLFGWLGRHTGDVCSPWPCPAPWPGNMASFSVGEEARDRLLLGIDCSEEWRSGEAPQDGAFGLARTL